MVRTRMTPPGIPDGTGARRLITVLFGVMILLGLSKVLPALSNFRVWGVGMNLSKTQMKITPIYPVCSVFPLPPAWTVGILMWMETECPIDGKRLFNLI